MEHYTINLFGNNVECELEVVNEKLVIRVPDHMQASLKSYLGRVLLRYGEADERDALSFEELIQRSVTVEKNIGGKMSEPTVKLPYEFAPEVKEKLIEAAALQEISATQLLVRIIDEKYQQVLGK